MESPNGNLGIQNTLGIGKQRSQSQRHVQYGVRRFGPTGMIKFEGNSHLKSYIMQCFYT